jgi:cytidylate kinase
MLPSHSSPHLTEALVRAGQHWQTRQPLETEVGGPPSTYSIALSREVGARGTTIAQAVGERLNWTVYDQELLERIAREMKLRTSLLESMDERRVHWLQECVEAFTSAPGVSTGAYVRHLIETLLSLGTHGSCIIVGRGAPHVLPSDTTLRVRLVAPLEERIKVMSEELGVSQQEAARQVASLERERLQFIKEHFHKDPTDPLNYDLVLNSGRFSVGECAELIIEALHRLQKHDRHRGEKKTG